MTLNNMIPVTVIAEYGKLPAQWKGTLIAWKMPHHPADLAYAIVADEAGSLHPVAMHHIIIDKAAGLQSLIGKKVAAWKFSTLLAGTGEHNYILGSGELLSIDEAKQVAYILHEAGTIIAVGLSQLQIKGMS